MSQLNTFGDSCSQGIPSVCPVKIPCHEAPLGCPLPPCAPPPKVCFETLVYLHQGWLSCSNMDKCQFIRVLINCINGEALCDVDHVALLDFSSNETLIGKFTTPNPLKNLQLCIQGTVYDKFCLKQNIYLEPCSYRVQIWPPPNTPYPADGDLFPAPIFAIVTVNCLHNCCRRWDIQLVSGCVSTGIQSDPNCNAACNTVCNTGCNMGCNTGCNTGCS